MISLIAAMSENRVIGRGGELPWRLSADLRRFKMLTTGHPVIMGRRTFESIGRPLPDRENIVLTRNHAFRADGIRIARCVDEAIDIAADCAAEDAGEIFIIGGEAIYQRFLPHCTRMYLTIVHANIDDGDAFFPPFDPARWRVVEEGHQGADDRNQYPFTFRTLERLPEA